MPVGSHTSLLTPAESIFPKTYINPLLLKTYLDVEFEKEPYSVKFIDDQYYIYTPKVLTSKQLSEITELHTIFERNPGKYVPKAADDASEIVQERNDASGTEQEPTPMPRHNTTSKNSVSTRSSVVDSFRRWLGWYRSHHQGSGRDDG